MFEYKTIFITEKENNGLFDKSYKFYKKEKQMKIKKILTEIVKIGGWIIVALEKLLEVL